VVAIDISSGLEKGQASRTLHPNAAPDRVQFLHGNLQHPPFATATMDVVHSVGVLHHTPSTLQTFLVLRPLLRPGGTLYVWLDKYERYVTPIVNAIRRFTSRLPARTFSRIARVVAIPFITFCAATNALRIRAYLRLSKREAALALVDIFGAPHAHYHSYGEVAHWYRGVGINETWECNVTRRGFGICGRLPSLLDAPDPFEASKRAKRSATGRAGEENGGVDFRATDLSMAEEGEC
jgi:SAM-dependent methyltransferase